MRKSGIFVKIYLWFWLATALVVAAQIGLDRLIAPSPPFAHHLRQAIDTVLSIYSRTALESDMQKDNLELVKLAKHFERTPQGSPSTSSIKRAKILIIISVPQNVADVFQRAKMSGETEFIFCRWEGIARPFADG